jgi:hemerythrin-like domain-containing protein
MELRKPIKRSSEIAPLSREHHDGLLLCWKIRSGIKNELDAGRITGYVLFYWETHLKAHFLDEEKYLFPLLSADHPKLAQAIREHGELVQQINNLQKTQTYSALSKFADELEAHIRFEERDLFNVIEQLADNVQLKKAGAQVAKRMHTTQHTWTDNFWEKQENNVL